MKPAIAILALLAALSVTQAYAAEKPDPPPRIVVTRSADFNHDSCVSLAEVQAVVDHVGQSPSLRDPDSRYNVLVEFVFWPGLSFREVWLNSRAIDVGDALQAVGQWQGDPCQEGR